MPSIKKVKEEIRTVEFVVSNETWHVKYRLGNMGPQLSDWVKTHGDDLGALRDMAQKVFIAWDVEDDEGHVIPITRQAMDAHEIPTPFLNAAFAAMYEDVTPTELKKSSYGERSLSKTA